MPALASEGWHRDRIGLCSGEISEVSGANPHGRQKRLPQSRGGRRPHRRGSRSLAEAAAPACRSALIQSWDEVVGARLAPLTRPEKIAWPPRQRRRSAVRAGHAGGGGRSCRGARTAAPDRRSDGRVNSFLGFRAVGRIRIVQKPVRQAEPQPKPAPRALTDGEAARLAAVVSGIESEELRGALSALGKAVLANRRVIKDL